MRGRIRCLLSRQRMRGNKKKTLLWGLKYKLVSIFTEYFMTCKWFFSVCVVGGLKCLARCECALLNSCWTCPTSRPTPKMLWWVFKRDNLSLVYYIMFALEFHKEIRGYFLSSIITSNKKNILIQIKNLRCWCFFFKMYLTFPHFFV